jgi:hypothetical protein
MITTKSNNIVFNNASNYNNITYFLDYPLNIKDESHVFLVSISDFQIPTSWPLISTYNNNNQFVYILNGTTYTYTIPDASYKSSDLLSLFNANILLTVSYSRTTGKFTFTHSTYNFTITNATTCSDELGFESGTNYSSSSKSLTSIKPIDLSGTKSLFIRTNLSCSNNDSRSGKTATNIINSIPINVDNFTVLRYVNYDGFRTKIKNQTISEINVIIEDDKQNMININNDYSITFEFNTVINQTINVDKNDLKDFETIKEETI